MIYYSETRLYILVHANVMECAGESNYMSILLHVQHPSPFERNKAKQNKQEKNKIK